MLIESSIHEQYIKTLNLGCFPRSVLEFQESQEFFPQIVFIDYQLQLLIQNEFNGLELLPASTFEASGNGSPREKLAQLINYAHSISANYNTASKAYEERLYYNVVLAQLFYLNSEFDEMHSLLSSMDVSATHHSDNVNVRDFITYLRVRYNVLIGLTNVEDSHKLWIEYLFHYPKHFEKSSIAANHWVDIIFNKVVSFITRDAHTPLSFQDLRLQKFGDNVSTLISLSSFLMREENRKFITSSFKNDYSTFLTSEVEARISQKDEFPYATDVIRVHDDFINTLYESLSHVPSHYKLVSPTLSKKFLISLFSKTYQSQIVASNYIKILIELNEYDEALAAFKTYISYIEKDQEQHGGHMNNLLSVIDTYSVCILNFNPINSFIPRIKSPKKFKYTTEDQVLSSLSQFITQLNAYLHELTNIADLCYDDVLTDFASQKLSFLYHKYNFNVLANDHSEFIQLISKAWFALGHYYYYLSTYQSPNLESLEKNTNQVLKFYKNSLIVNSTGNVTYLFNYALALAYNRHLQPSVKLCKFILKKYPESFKTWNLLVLLLTSLENYNPDFIKHKTKPGATANNGNGSALNKSPINGSATLNGNGAAPPSLKEVEKFINNALNIAGIFIVKNRKNDIKLTIETKFEILQLKLTQMAVWEQLYGVQYILDYLPEVFILFHELFDEVVIEKIEAPEPSESDFDARPDARWSHRPSFIDPNPNSTNDSNVVVLIEKQIAKDRIKKMSKAGTTNEASQPQTVIRQKPKEADLKDPLKLRLYILEKKILQEIWLWTSRIYLKIGLNEDAEQCIVEAENVYEPNIKTFTHLGLLTSKSRKFLSLQEFERSLEILSSEDQQYNKRDYGITLLGVCRLFIIDDKIDNSLFTSSKDFNAAIIRLKNLLEHFSQCWPYGFNNSELWYYLGIIYEKLDDKILLAKSLWKCVELEDFRPVRGFEVCEEFGYY